VRRDVARFLRPLIELDVRISRIQLSDHLPPGGHALAILPDGSPCLPFDTADIGHEESDIPIVSEQSARDTGLRRSHNCSSLRTNQSTLYMEGPVAVTDPEVGTPPIQYRVQLLDRHADLHVRRKRPRHLTDPPTDSAQQ